MTLFVLESCDLCGKSTIVNGLSKHLDIPIYKRFAWKDRKEWKRFVDFQGKIEMAVLSQIDFSKVDLIIDRMDISTLIYPRVFHRKVDLSYFKKYKLNNVFYIFVTANWDTILKRYRKRGDKFINKNKLRTLHSEFNDYFKKHKKSTKNILINTTYVNKKDALDAALQIVKEERSTKWHKK